ncbi:MAG TPA: HK97 family phage prohead protease [Stellaceae bacterium]|nr:HK97 family phage prohead protease [Stellaceae bacterium]
MRFYAPLAKIDAAEHMVWGYASTEAEDDQGETVTRDALSAALGDYLKFANIREMHQMSAVGVAEEAGVDDRGLYVGARIVDPRAWDKVTAGVYKGFSIGGRVKSRDPADRTVITALSLTEISLVDRPANPEAVFDCWKAEGGQHMAEAAAAAREPVQIWYCGVAAHRHLAKAEAVRCLEKRGAEDGDYAQERIDVGGPPASEKAAVAGDLSKSLGDLMKAVAGEILPRLDALAKRVEDIAATPLPPLTAGRGLAGISKREDSGGFGEDLVAALSRMTDEERTLALIKAAHANPIRG